MLPDRSDRYLTERSGSRTHGPADGALYLSTPVEAQSTSQGQTWPCSCRALCVRLLRPFRLAGRGPRRLAASEGSCQACRGDAAVRPCTFGSRAEFPLALGLERSSEHCLPQVCLDPCGASPVCLPGAGGGGVNVLPALWPVGQCQAALPLPRDPRRPGEEATRRCHAAPPLASAGSLLASCGRRSLGKGISGEGEWG